MGPYRRRSRINPEFQFQRIIRSLKPCTNFKTPWTNFVRSAWLFVWMGLKLELLVWIKTDCGQITESYIVHWTMSKYDQALPAETQSLLFMLSVFLWKNSFLVPLIQIKVATRAQLGASLRRQKPSWCEKNLAVMGKSSAKWRKKRVLGRKS